MTALEERLRFVLRSGPLPVKEPYGPDVTVFGPQQPERDPPEAWGITGTCRTHAVQWGGAGRECWCCEAGLPMYRTTKEGQH